MMKGPCWGKKQSDEVEISIGSEIGTWDIYMQLLLLEISVGRRIVDFAHCRRPKNRHSNDALLMAFGQRH